jgi:hypothetical protein
MSEPGKILILLGLFLIITSGLFLIGGKIGLLGRLPGDFIVKKKNFTLIFPLASSIALSIILTLLFYLFGLFKK